MFVSTDCLQLVSMDAIPGPESAIKRRLMASGEQLLADRGFNGVSMHEIAQSAKNKNRYAVQYHFGDMTGLIRAITDFRSRSINLRRQALLSIAEAKGQLSKLTTLLELLFLPIAEQVDDRQRHSHARIRIQYLTRLGYDRPADQFSAQVSAANGPTKYIMNRLATELELSETEIYDRIFLQLFVLYSSLIDRDSMLAQDGGAQPASLEVVLLRAIRMASAALSADLD